MSELEGRVAVITGAGRGLGREYALLFASEGAAVVVNDRGGHADGSGASASPAEDVAAEIRARGGRAVANTDDVADWEGGRRLVDQAVTAFGDLHVVVNNAGILRDRALVNLTEQDWDSVMRVHLRGHFCPTRWAAVHWRAETKAGRTVDRAIVNTSSPSGLLGNFGQANYGTAKAGIAAFTILSQLELDRYGVRCNAVAPAARTRLTDTLAGTTDGEPGEVDDAHPANVAPVVAYLATRTCRLRGKVIFARGRRVQVLEPWRPLDVRTTEAPWTVSSAREALDPAADLEFATLADLFPDPS